MNIENIGGIPAHPLLVHAPVVLLPLLAVCVIVASIKANWHKISSIPLAILSGVVIVTSWLAKDLVNTWKNESVKLRSAKSTLNMVSSFLILPSSFFLQ